MQVSDKPDRVFEVAGLFKAIDEALLAIRGVKRTIQASLCDEFIELALLGG